MSVAQSVVCRWWVRRSESRRLVLPVVDPVPDSFVFLVHLSSAHQPDSRPHGRWSPLPAAPPELRLCETRCDPPQLRGNLKRVISGSPTKCARPCLGQSPDRKAATLLTPVGELLGRPGNTILALSLVIMVRSPYGVHCSANPAGRVGLLGGLGSGKARLCVQRRGRGSSPQASGMGPQHDCLPILRSGYRGKEVVHPPGPPPESRQAYEVGTVALRFDDPVRRAYVRTAGPP